MTRTSLILNLLAATAMLSAQGKSPESALGAALHQEEVQGNLDAAIAAYKKLLATPNLSRSIAAQALYHLGLCYQKLGNAEARKAFERLVAQYADQKDLAAQARTHLAAMGELRAPAGAIAFRRLIVDTGKNTPWSISSDGRHLSFTHYDTGNVGVRDIETGEDRVLTQYGNWDHTKGYTDQNVISHDGKYIAFWHYMYHAADGQLRVIGTDGRGERTLYRAKAGEWGIPTDWSPDGKYVLIQLERGKDNSLSEGDTDFALISAENGSVRVLKTAHYIRRYRPRILFSPDGRYVAYDYPPEQGNPNGDLYVIPVNGGPEVRLAPDSAADVLLGWSPDGNRLVFASDRSGSFGIWAVRVSSGKQTGELEQIKSDTGRPWPMGITAAGAFYYTLDAVKSGIYLGEIDVANGRMTKPLVRMAGLPADTTSAPAWSPDGARLAYRFHAGSGQPFFSILNVATGEQHRLLPRAATYGSPHFSADGESILTGGEVARPQRRGLLRVSLATGEAALVAEARDEFHPSADARHLYLAIRGERIQKIVRRDLPSNQEHVLYSGTRLARALSVSPDDSLIAFVLAPDKPEGQASLCVMSTDGGEPRVLHTGGAGTGLPWTPRQITWAPDSKTILFVSAQRGSRAIWKVSTAGGAVVKIDSGVPIGKLSELTLHPDGKRLALTVENTTQELWALENFLPH